MSIRRNKQSRACSVFMFCWSLHLSFVDLSSSINLSVFRTYEVLEDLV